MKTELQPTDYVRTTRADPMFRTGLLIAACLVTGLSASAQQSGKPNLDPAYQGVWALNGSCDDVTFVFGPTWIERAGEDICHIDKIVAYKKGVRVTASCRHEGLSVGPATYDMVSGSDGAMIFSNWSSDPVKRCGPVPQNLIDAYKDGN
jgi:hypothetical protein